MHISLNCVSPLVLSMLPLMNSAVVYSAAFTWVMSTAAMGIRLSNKMLDTVAAALSGQRAMRLRRMCISSIGAWKRSRPTLIAHCPPQHEEELALAVHPRHCLHEHPFQKAPSSRAGEPRSTGASSLGPSSNQPANKRDASCTRDAYPDRASASPGTRQPSSESRTASEWRSPQRRHAQHPFPHYSHRYSTALAPGTVSPR